MPLSHRPDIQDTDPRAIPDAWNWYIQIGSATYRHAERAYISHAADGTSVFELTIEGNFSDAHRAPVRVFCGFQDRDEDLTEYFTGDLFRPAYDPHTGHTKAEAYGVLGAMSRGYFHSPLLMQGMTLKAFFGHIRKLLHDPRARINVSTGNLAIEDDTMPPENTLREGAESVLEGFDHIMRDRPGFGLDVKPRPRPAALATYDAVYSAPDFPIGEPKIDPKPEGPYALVIIHRRNQEGIEEVWAEAPVTQAGQYPARPNEIYWVHDFDGDQLTAQDIAKKTARAIAIQQFIGKLTNTTPDPRILPDSPILIIREEEEEDNIYTRHYAAVVTESNLDILESSFDLAFDALLVKNELHTGLEAPEQRDPYSRRALGEAATYDTAFGEDDEGVFFRLDANVDYAGEDAEGMWIDPDYDPNLAGEDDGLYVEVS